MSIHFGDSTQIDTAPSSASADDIHPNVDDVGYQYASTTSNNYINAYSLTFTPKKANSKVMLWHGGFVYGYGHKRFYENVFSSLKNNDSFLIDGLSGRKSLQVIHAIYESIETGARVDLQYSPKVNRLGYG